MQVTANAVPARTPARTGTVRVTGALYLLVILCGLSAELALRGPLVVPGDAAATAAAIAGGLPLFRAGLVADVVMMLADIALALLFWSLLAPVHAGLARAAAAFRLVQAGLIGASLLLLAGAPVFLAAGLPEAAGALAQMHGTGYDIGLIPFGVASLLMMVLLLRSGGVPRPIAWGLGAAGLVYITGSLLRLTAPDLWAAFQPAYLVCILAEGAFCLWLLTAARL